jgi:hypothetical protein
MFMRDFYFVSVKRIQNEPIEKVSKSVSRIFFIFAKRGDPEMFAGIGFHFFEVVLEQV